MINELIVYEKRKGFCLLWDGKFIDGWWGVRFDKFLEVGWGISDGELIVLELDGDWLKCGGDIIIVDKFINFELEFDFKIIEGVNSGIKYFINLDFVIGVGFFLGCEF